MRARARAGPERSDAREDLATANLNAFLTAVRARAHDLEQVPIHHRTAGLAGDPVRDPAADRASRFGWECPCPTAASCASSSPVELAGLRDDHTAAAPCLYVDGRAWW